MRSQSSGDDKESFGDTGNLNVSIADAKPILWRQSQLQMKASVTVRFNRRCEANPLATSLMGAQRAHPSGFNRRCEANPLATESAVARLSVPLSGFNRRCEANPLATWHLRQ